MEKPDKITPAVAREAWKPIYDGLGREAQQGMLLTFMEWRGMQPWDTVCPHCNGTGSVLYGSGSTWRGGIGAAAMTRDVCDSCWGSGAANQPGTDLRKLEKELNELRKFKKKHEQGKQ